MLTELEARLTRCTLEDRDALRRRARRLRADSNKRLEPDVLAARLKQFEQAVRSSEALYERRRATVPNAQVLSHLPIAAAAMSIVSAIREHQVVIVSGDTGSGKSTQLAKLCLQAGRGIDGQIAHTQPRRVAARSIARRIAHELGQPLGESVGFKVRFDARVRRESHIKVLTDGLLLAELGRDRQLRAYDTIIVDEAHERSLNIDFLFGYLKRLCQSRPELRIVISSATLDEQRFSAFFDQAPVVEVYGRSFPVQVRYRPAENEVSLPDQVCDAAQELSREGDGDVLVFLSGEREIHEVAGRLRHALGNAFDVLALYARLPIAKQEQVFAAHTRRRIVLATNVAETSLTVPGVRFVIDAGRARVGRHSPGSAVQHLPVEFISQASAKQRAGRCGREAAGICIRLYSEAQYENFADFIEPEILRTDLAAVLLRMRALGVRDLRQFPLLDAPAQRNVNDGVRLLRELGAFDESGQLTPLGRQLARLPLDPRVGRMLLAAREHDCVAEVLVIAAGLSAGDPRERHQGQRGPMAQHLRFEDERSDFLRLLKIWHHVQSNTRGSAMGSLAQVCRQARLSFSRLQEWREIHLQLRIAAREIGLKARTEPASYASVHRALLSGLLRHVGSRVNERDYRGIRGNNFRISAGSGQSHRRVRWVLAAELVDAGSTIAHTVAKVRPEWVEEAAGALIRRSHFDAWWDARRAQPMVYEQTSLYALTVTARRKILFASVSREGAREVFIRGALVEARFRTDAPVIARAWRWIAQRRELEAKLRRPDPAINHERLYQFFEAHLPESVWDAVSFEAWWPQAGAAQTERLSLAKSIHALAGTVPADLEQRSAALHVGDWDIEEEHHDEDLDDDIARLSVNFPDAIVLPNARVPLSYVFAPGEENDGISLSVPRELLAGVREHDVERAVPGLLRDRVLAMLRALPKSKRRRIGPAADALRRFMMERQLEEPLAEAVTRFLATRFDVEVEQQFWGSAEAQARIPPHLRVRYRVLDDSADELDCSRDLELLQRRHSKLRDAALERERDCAANHTRWSFGELSSRIQVAHNGASGWVYPALLGNEQGVLLSQFDSEARARAVHARGLLRLAIGVCELDIPRLVTRVSDGQRLCLMNALVSPRGERETESLARLAGKDQGPCSQLLHDIVMAALERAFDVPEAWEVRDEPAFENYCKQGQARIWACIEQHSEAVAAVLGLHRNVLALLNDTWPSAYESSLNDVRAQLVALVYHGFVASTPVEHFDHLLRYLHGAQARLQKLRGGGAHDADKLERLKPLTDRARARAQAHARRGRRDPMLQQYRWLLEEFRISLFAQELGTGQKVSKQRLDRLWAQVPP
ncbi:MAG: ATP-dependent helicase HrpA [Gammaproteobacteria bacterium]|jgi:ATP-dependent helicase HrpA